MMPDCDCVSIASATPYLPDLTDSYRCNDCGKIWDWAEWLVRGNPDPVCTCRDLDGFIDCPVHL